MQHSATLRDKKWNLLAELHRQSHSACIRIVFGMYLRNGCWRHAEAFPKMPNTYRNDAETSNFCAEGFPNVPNGLRNGCGRVAEHAEELLKVCRMIAEILPKLESGYIKHAEISCCTSCLFETYCLPQCCFDYWVYWKFWNSWSLNNVEFGLWTTRGRPIFVISKMSNKPAQ